MMIKIRRSSLQNYIIVLLLFCLSLSCIFNLTQEANAAVVQQGTSGTCSWTIDENGLFVLYPTNGISGTLDSINVYKNWNWYDFRDDVKKVVVQNGVIANKNINGMFYDMSNCEEIDLSGLNTSNVTSAKLLFAYCSDLKSLNLSNFDTSKVTSMANMFNGSSSLLGSDGTYFLSRITFGAGFKFIGTNHGFSITGDNWVKILNSDGTKVNDNTKYSNNDLVNLNSDTTPSIEGTWSKYGVDDDISEIIIQGTCGTCSWTINSDWHLRIYPTNGSTGTLEATVNNSSSITYDLTWPWQNSDFSRLIKSISVEDGVVCPQNSARLFWKLSSVKEIDASGLITTNVTNMYYMFADLYDLTALNLSNFNTANVTNMYGMFTNCHDLESLNISNFDTAMVTDMGYMFNACESLKALVDLRGFNTLRVTNMDHMFASSNIDAFDFSHLETDNVVDMGYMFYNTTTSKPLNIEFNTSKVKMMEYMFSNCNAKSIDVSSFDTKSVVHMYSMFHKSGVESLTLNFDTSSVTSMSAMFNDCLNLTNLTLSGFSNNQTTSMDKMFRGCKSLTTLNLVDFKAPVVTSMKYMFAECPALVNLDLSTFKNNIGINSTGVNMSYMFYDSNLSGVVNFNDLATNKATNMSYMFGLCDELTSLDVSDFNTAAVTDMEGMFYDCSNIETLDLSNFSTESVASMKNMFDGMSALKVLDISNFSTANLSTNSKMSGMFSDCNNLQKIIFGTKFQFKESRGYSTFLENISNKWVKTHDMAQNLTNDSKIYNASEVKALSGDSLAGTWQKRLVHAIYSDEDNTLYVFEDFIVENVDSYKGIKISKIFYDIDRIVNQWGDYVDTIKKVKVMNGFTPVKTEYLFKGLKACVEMDVALLDMSTETSLYGMFAGCESLRSLDLSEWNVSKVTGANRMFYNCYNLTYVNLSNFATGTLSSVKQMFLNCYNLRELDLSHLKFSSYQTITAETFGNCTNLKKISFSNTFKFASDADLSFLGDNWIKTRDGNGKKLYDRIGYSATVWVNPTSELPLSGTWIKDYQGDEYITNPDGSIEYISKLEGWEIVSDEVWTYTFEIFDDTLVYHLFERALNGYTSEAMEPYYITIVENEGTLVNRQEEFEIEDTDGELIIKKTVEGNVTNDSFKFIVTLTGPEIGGLQVFNGVAFENGVGQFYLKDGESKKFTLPKDTQFKVEETVYENYTITYTTSNTGTINIDNVQTVNVTNTYVPPVIVEKTANITLRKEILGNLETDEKFTFNLYMTGLKPNETYIMSNGGKFTATEDGSIFYVLQLGANESVVIMEIPIGAKYQIIEKGGEYRASYEIVDNNKQN